MNMSHTAKRKMEKIMTRKSPNKLWAFGPLVSILLLVVAYYLKVPAFREAVNARIPWAKEHLSQFVPPPEVIIIRDPPKPTIPPLPAEPPPLRPAAAEQVPKISPPVPGAKNHDDRITMQDFMANPSLWPKTVRLRRATEFPAVLDGKVIGRIRAPAGTEARLVIVKDQQVGVEFRGGGAWVAIGETDLMEKAKIAAR
jgi:hypothetical protein